MQVTIESLRHGPQIAFFDDDDDAASIVDAYALSLSVGWKRRTFYAVQHRRLHRGEDQMVHRLLIKAPRGSRVAHLDGNGLNNRRSNLLVTDASGVGLRGTRPLPGSKTGIRGVHQISSGRFRAQRTVRGVPLHLGYFDSLADAAAALR